MLVLPVSANEPPAESPSIPNLDDLRELVPPEIRDQLPGDIFTSDTNGILSVFDGAFFVNFLLAGLSNAISGTAGTFFTLVGIILVAAVGNAMKDTLNSKSSADMINWAVTLVTAVVVYSIAVEQFVAVQAMMTRLHGFVSGLLPFMTAIQIAGGNLTTSAVTGSMLTFMLALMSGFAFHGLVPLLQICFGLNLTSHVAKSVNLDKISDFVRNGFLALVSATTGVLLIIFSVQTNVAQSTDTVAGRAVRFAAGSWIPVVGNSVSEAMRTVMGSLEVIKSVTGAVGIIAILLMTLPTVLSLVATRLTIALAAAMAGTLGCESTERMLVSVGKLLNFVLAVAIIMGMIMIFAMGVFMNTTFGG